jgi:hypothetical protein
LTVSAGDSQLWGTVYRDTGGGMSGLSFRGCLYEGAPTVLVFAAGETYYVEVVRGYDASALTARLDIALVTPPANDSFANATRVPSLPFTDSPDTSAGSVEPGEPALCNIPPSERTLWYAYTPSATQWVQANVNAHEPGAGLAVYVGFSLSGLTKLRCQSDFFAVNVHTVAETTYYFQIGLSGQRAHGIEFTINRVTPPPNDEFDTATVVTALPFADAVNTVDATTAPDDPGCDSNNSVWYRYTPVRDVVVDVNPAGSTYDAVVGVFTGTRGSLQGGDCGRRLLLSLQAGVTYHLKAPSAPTTRRTSGCEADRVARRDTPRAATRSPVCSGAISPPARLTTCSSPLPTASAATSCSPCSICPR